MDSYKHAGLIIAIAIIVFSLLTLVSFFYCMYVEYRGNWDRDQAVNNVENDAVKSDKTKHHSNPTNLQ